MVSVINQALCKGCGTCVAACPAGAIQGAHFSNAQVLAEMQGLLFDAWQTNGAQQGDVRLQPLPA
jgi:heterodisulfide reductase subunit A